MDVKVTARDKRTFNSTLKSARIGVPEAQYEVGLMYANGIGVERDFEQALVWIRQAADKGLAVAQYLLATRYAGGVGIDRDDYQAVLWYLKAAEQGHAKALFRLGKLYTAPLPELANSCYAKAADLGQAEAQYAMGAAFASGKGTSRDYPQAVYWYHKAAAQGLAAAQSALGALYASGQGVARDLDEALSWYRKAAGQNHAPAQVAMEYIDSGGHGRGKAGARRKAGSAERRRDPERWARAAELGDAADDGPDGPRLAAADGAAVAKSPVAMAAVSMADALKQFDANGRQLGNAAAPSTKSLNMPGTQDPNHGLLAPGGGK